MTHLGIIHLPPPPSPPFLLQCCLLRQKNISLSKKWLLSEKNDLSTLLGGKGGLGVSLNFVQDCRDKSPNP